jgi:hypothetical protein
LTTQSLRERAMSAGNVNGAMMVFEFFTPGIAQILKLPVVCLRRLGCVGNELKKHGKRNGTHQSCT